MTISVIRIVDIYRLERYSRFEALLYIGVLGPRSPAPVVSPSVLWPFWAEFQATTLYQCIKSKDVHADMERTMPSLHFTLGGVQDPASLKLLGFIGMFCLLMLLHCSCFKLMPLEHQLEKPPAGCKACLAACRR